MHFMMLMQGSLKHPANNDSLQQKPVQSQAMSSISLNAKDIHESWMVRNKEFKFPQADNNRIQLLRRRWETAIKSILVEITTLPGADDSIVTWFDRIVTMHSEESRHYHTLCHLEEMFGFIDLAFGPGLKSDKGKNDDDSAWNAILELSVFFHDSVYDATSSTNEEDSAKLFLSFVAELTSQTDWWVFKTVERFIIATKTHSVDGLEITEAKKVFLHLFLDADMSVLGKDPQAYDHYASLIRLEYLHVPHGLYCEKRAEILRSFIGSVKKAEGSSESTSKTVYLTSSMRDAVEERAIANLQREIGSLERGIIPE